MRMIVRVRFEQPTEDDLQAMQSLAGILTDDRQSIGVAPDPENPDWLVAEFSMPREAQYETVDKIDRVLHFMVENRLDSTISFPRTAAEIERARQKNERRKARRGANRSGK